MSSYEVKLGTVPLPAGDQVTMSPVPVALQAGVPAKMGIDEAGRGSVLGPMPYAGAVWACGCELEAEDWDDSKALTLQKRNDLATKFTKLDNVAWVVHPISAAAISTAMLAKEGSRQSLNVLAWNATVGIVKRVISAGINLRELYVDTVGDPTRYQAFLQQQLGRDIRIVVEKKADAKFPIVGAASILAKVTRDGSMLRAEATGRASDGSPLQTALGSYIPAQQQAVPAECSTPVPPGGSPSSCSSGTKRTREGEAKPGDESWAMGSGYPSDPATKAWLSKHVHHVFGWGELVRFSWSTASDMFAASSQVAWEWEDDESPKGGQGMSALSRLWRKTDLPAVMLDAGMNGACEGLLS